MECNNCHKQIPDSSKFCMHCGAKQKVDYIVCPKCGYKNPLDALYCTECGKETMTIDSYEKNKNTDFKGTQTNPDIQGKIIGGEAISLIHETQSWWYDFTQLKRIRNRVQNLLQKNDNKYEASLLSLLLSLIYAHYDLSTGASFNKDVYKRIALGKDRKFWDDASSYITRSIQTKMEFTFYICDNKYSRVRCEGESVHQILKWFVKRICNIHKYYNS